ncbi:5-hydroxytryptamine receptor 3A-like [Phyllobates terribilis]|uniref:5-hydroxytryptamine receptor 3A-like n=1 Tax=Phyllobates terribilis TaxID=111132 RepID=UPI003CCA7045
MIFGWILGIIFYLLHVCSGIQESSIIKQSNSTPGQLLHYLMEGYEAKLRPVRDWRKATMVHIDILILGILSVDEKKQLLTIYYLYNQYWSDEFLQWNPTDFDNMTIISITTESIWFPDIQIAEL